jgi:hypothetical protein
VSDDLTVTLPGELVDQLIEDWRFARTHGPPPDPNTATPRVVALIETARQIPDDDEEEGLLVDLETAALWAFEHFVFIDKANACMHTAAVRYSPVTFRLAQALDQTRYSSNFWVQAVFQDRGRYEEDPGR